MFKITIKHNSKEYVLSPDMYGIDGEYLFEFDPEGGILNIALLAECEIIVEKIDK
jgi:hypothetical protein